MLNHLLRLAICPTVGFCLISTCPANTLAGQGPIKSGEKNKVTVEVIFPPDIPSYVEPLKEEIRKNIAVAVHSWTDNFEVKPCTLTVLFESATDNGVNGGSYWAPPGPRSRNGDSYGRFKGKPILETGASYELRTGVDSNGNEHDLQIHAGRIDLERMWFDPDIERRNSEYVSQFAVPTELDWQKSKVDAHSLFVHEVGHALGFSCGNGAVTPFDEHLFVYEKNKKNKFVGRVPEESPLDKNRIEFIGPNAVRANGGRPIKMETVNHLSYWYYLQGDHVAMNACWKPSVRIFVAPVCVAMLVDCGLKPKGPVASPPFKNRRIVYALYGTDGNYQDVTDVVGSKIVNKKLSFRVSDESLGVKLATDEKKYFRIKIVSGGMAVYEVTCAEGQLVECSDIEVVLPSANARS